MPPYLLGFAVACVASLVVTPLVIRVAAARGLYDAPTGGRRVHTQPVPRIGGIAVSVAMLLGLATVVFTSGGLPEHERFYLGMLAGGGVLLVTGLVDDLRGVSPSGKLIAQIVASTIVYACDFRIEVLGIGSGSGSQLGWLSFPVTVLWVVIVVNAFNLIDGLDGLATGIALVALGATSALLVAVGDSREVLIVALALLGALFGFLRYNFNPARIFLGDSGSLFVGFMLAVLSMYRSTKGATMGLVIVPFFALAIPLLDTSLAVLRRWLRGVSFATADGRHIHHRLLALGLTHRRAVLLLYAVSTMLAGVGLVIALAPPTTVALITTLGAGLSLLMLLWGVRRLDYHEFTEIGAMVGVAPVKLRKLIRDRILARDVADAISRAETLEEVNAVLRQNAHHFCFLHIEVCREGDPGQRFFGVDENPIRVWKVEYPVEPRAGTDELLILRICCPADGIRAHGAERVARILAPTIHQHFEQSRALPMTFELNAVRNVDPRVSVNR